MKKAIKADMKARKMEIMQMMSGEDGRVKDEEAVVFLGFPIGQATIRQDTPMPPMR